MRNKTTAEFTERETGNTQAKMSKAMFLRK
jgi:hypothetical protein